MNRLEELIKAASARPGIIIHLGAGTCSEFETYTALNPEKIIFVEADQDLAETAADAFAKTAHVSIIQGAIASKDGQQTLNITNNRRFSSLLLPDQLLTYYPNVEVQGTSRVETMSLAQVCKNVGVSSNTDNLLVVEIQGLEREVFATAEVGILQQFKWVIIRSSETDLYTPASDLPRRNLAEVMQYAGFKVLVFAEDASPFVNFLCIRDDAAIANVELKSHVAEQVDTIRVLEHNLSKQSSSLDELRNTKTQLQLDLDSKSHELDTAQALISSMTSERELQQKELAEMQQSLRINNKLILKSDTDLRDLQLQYSAALQHQEQQHILLSEVKEKLRQASEFYQKLNLQNLVLDAELLEQTKNGESESLDGKKD